MHRLRNIIGKIVVSAETGDRLGSVSDALLEQGGDRVVGLVLGSGLLTKQHVMPFENVQTLGGMPCSERALQSSVKACGRKAGSDLPTTA